MSDSQLIQRYLDGPSALRTSLAGLPPAALDALPIPGTWSIRQVVCHIADAEILYADRIKRVLAEDKPQLIKADPDGFIASGAIGARNIEDELQLIESIRIHIDKILKAASPAQFERTGIHSSDGPLSLRTIVERITDHIPHHIVFITAKREKLAV